MSSRDIVRREAESLGYEQSVSLLDTWTDVFRKGAYQVEISYSRHGRQVLSIWVNNDLWRGRRGRPGALDALTQRGWLASAMRGQR